MGDARWTESSRKRKVGARGFDGIHRSFPASASGSSGGLFRALSKVNRFTFGVFFRPNSGSLGKSRDWLKNKKAKHIRGYAWLFLSSSFFRFFQLNGFKSRRGRQKFNYLRLFSFCLVFLVNAPMNTPKAVFSRPLKDSDNVCAMQLRNGRRRASRLRWGLQPPWLRLCGPCENDTRISIRRSAVRRS